MWGLLGFVALVCVWVYFYCYSVSGIAGVGLCKVGLVGWSTGGKYVGRRFGLMTGWERMEGEGEGRRREWMRRGRKSSWEREQWILAQEKEGE
jgi:hypothetical protein